MRAQNSFSSAASSGRSAGVAQATVSPRRSTPLYQGVSSFTSLPLKAGTPSLAH